MCIIGDQNPFLMINYIRLFFPFEWDVKIKEHQKFIILLIMLLTLLIYQFIEKHWRLSCSNVDVEKTYGIPLEPSWAEVLVSVVLSHYK